MDTLPKSFPIKMYKKKGKTKFVQKENQCKLEAIQFII
jgi:hypothetical protein